jgi:hypothetical protein
VYGCVDPSLTAQTDGVRLYAHATCSGVYPVLPQWLLLVQGVLSMLLPWSTLMLTRLPSTAQCAIVLAVAAAAMAVQVQLSTAVSLPLPFHPALAVVSDSASAPLDATAHAATLSLPLVRTLVPIGLHG